MVYYRTASHGPYPHPFALSALAPETIAECAGLSGIARGYKTRWDPSSFFLTSIVVLFKMVALLVLATIIGSLVPAVPVPSSLAPVHNATIAYSPRMPFGDLGRTFTSCVGGLLPAGGVSLAVPDFWSSKSPVRRTVCTSHGLRLAATPAQCLAIVSAQLGIPSPTDLTLSPPVALLTLPARRPFLTLPAAPRPVILALPAPIHAPILMLPASKHVPVLMLPAPKLLLTLSGPPDLIPAPASSCPLSTTFTPSPSQLVRVFATKYVVDPRKTVTVLVMAYLIVLTSCWMLACIKEDALDLADSFGLLVRCVWVGPPREWAIGLPWMDTTDAPDELDADAFASSCSVASRGPIPSTESWSKTAIGYRSVEHLTLSTEVALLRMFCLVASTSMLCEPLDDRSDLDTETDDGSSLVTKSIGSAASVSSFDVASNAEANAPGAKEGLETEQVAPVSEPPTEAAVPPPASDIPPRSEPVSNEPRDDCAQDEDPETGLSASRWAPGHGSDDEESLRRYPQAWEARREEGTEEEGERVGSWRRRIEWWRRGSWRGGRSRRGWERGYWFGKEGEGILQWSLVLPQAKRREKRG
ncbi:hypothetical protein RhiLY_03082 [Ceratobasidium sp. AG-Ba]|nr:hypothetical protein RhiLY_03082 [Ceratobasidium sp. AG-Ba]